MNKKFEIWRQAIHALIGVVAVLLLHFSIIGIWSILAITIFIALLFFIRIKKKIWLLDKIIGIFERPEKKHYYEGPLTLFIGMFLALLFFEKNIALASIMILSLGDAAGTAFGKFFGKKKIPWSSKTFVGSAAGIVFSFAGASFFVPIWHGIIASIVAMAVESFDKDFTRINDNILVPVVAGCVLAIIKI